MTAQQRFVRLVTNTVVRAPFLWRFARGTVARQFDRLAADWDGARATPERLLPLATALDALPATPGRVLDVGTGTGSASRLVTERWPDADVLGVDVSKAMVAEARRRATSDRQRYEVIDSAALPHPDGSFDLVVLNNMIPFFDELARVTAPGGWAAIAYARGPRTPIWVPLERCRRELSRRGFDSFREVAAGDGVALLAHRADRA